MKVFRKPFKKNEPQFIGKVVKETISEDGGVIFTVDLTKDGTKEIKKILRKLR